MPKVDPKTKKIKELESLLDASVRQNEFKAGQIKELKEEIEQLGEQITDGRRTSVNNFHEIIDQAMWMRNFIERMCLPATKLKSDIRMRDDSRFPMPGDC